METQNRLSDMVATILPVLVLFKQNQNKRPPGWAVNREDYWMLDPASSLVDYAHPGAMGYRGFARVAKSLGPDPRCRVDHSLFAAVAVCRPRGRGSGSPEMF